MAERRREVHNNVESGPQGADSASGPEPTATRVAVSDRNNSLFYSLRIRLDMIDIVAHTGTEHPNLIWVAAPSLFAFLLGLGIGTYSDRIRSVIGLEQTETN
ncbi:hypothetical protein OB919_06890 [Halobacteria archaeon AArc-curdl1]|uniref:Uncharacterized protein n=1 Tax=Natronosalvus hydrolyticus TaxID=2979988 RepID=A0AAP3E6D3_9EURY|nr:hypothetical protein [Halobacteria archaeon AArc-curdl1]